MKPVLLVYVFLLGFTTLANAQQIQNFKSQIVGDSVQITYDLVGSDPRQTFEVRVFGIINKYKQRLYRAKGDVDKNIKPGKNKRITWNNKEELTSYKLENMSFSVDAILFNSPIIFLNPTSTTTARRGKELDIRWIGGDSFESLKLALYLNNTRIRSIGNISNGGRYTWDIPQNLKPGDNYQLRMSRAGAVEETIMSPKFTIRRKIPLAYKLIPAAALAGLGYFIFSGSGGSNIPSDILPPPQNPTNPQ